MRFADPLLEADDAAASLPAAILDAMPEQICVLDVSGEVIAVNEAWVRFAQDNGVPGGDGFLGANYFDICDLAYLGSTEMDNVADGLRAVLAGPRTQYRHTYPCHAPRERRWFQLSARRLDDASGPMLLIMHHNVTAWITTHEVPPAELPPALRPGEDVHEMLLDLAEPLTSIAFDTETCRRRLQAQPPIDFMAMDALAHISEQIDRAAALIRKIRTRIIPPGGPTSGAGDEASRR